MVSASGGGLTAASLAYDVQGRLYSLVTASTTTRFLYDGVEAIAEYDGAGTVLRRYVRGAGVDDVIAWYEGSGTSDKRFLTTDAKGSVTAVTNSAGNALSINKYDEYGVPAAGNLGRFQYTGQMWIAELGLYYYKARFYNPETGPSIAAFAPQTVDLDMQTDPIGLSGGLNLYAYTGNDPVNASDPSGLTPPTTEGGGIVVTSARIATPLLPSFAGFSHPTDFSAPPPNFDNIEQGPEVVVTAEMCSAPAASSNGFVGPVAGAAGTEEVIVTATAGAASSPVLSALAVVLGPLLLSGDTRQNHDFVYRGLSATDIRNLSSVGAILPKAPNANATFGATLIGSPSQFINASRDYDVAEKFAVSGSDPGFLVATIDLNRVPGPHYDISAGSRLLGTYVSGIAYDEAIVLIQGPVPASAISRVEKACKK